MAVPTPGHAATTAARIWIPSIIYRIARFLPRNEVACSLRVVDKAIAAMLQTPEFTTVRLSEPVPHHAFTWRWGRPGAMRDLTRAQRHELVWLTVASGATANLALAARVAGCGLTDEVGYAAGKAGQPGSCALLAELGCDMGRAVEGAAAGGHLALCEELLASEAGDLCSFLSCAFAAAKAGHIHVVEWMGCDLAALHRYAVQFVGPKGEEEGHEAWFEEVEVRVVAAAAGSPTTDWRANLEWLKSRIFS
ncbi:hypothetical protein GPECTOR_56g418 [Gonium pectorale]|uniref:Uncharacterized protein n=1 Tax=Gonium pectorale TaxID=33097 RepID=A0A150G663_GONPE|nr:hypothetical protein GPECTOR_56g418 [Gonium pectorale]|eukprot:KXZ45321.1 hypothetical protein GPECTOR_56g418 [Gonium pectorale]